MSYPPTHAPVVEKYWLRHWLKETISIVPNNFMNWIQEIGTIVSCRQLLKKLVRLLASRKQYL